MDRTWFWSGAKYREWIHTYCNERSEMWEMNGNISVVE